MNILDFFPQKKEDIRKQQDSILATAISTLVEEENYLQELLFVMSALFDDGTLSIIDVETRKVLVSMDDNIASIEHVAKGIKKISEREYFLRVEKNGIPFRRECNCIHVIPLPYNGCVKYSLMVEQQANVCKVTERILNVLALAVRNYVVEEYLKETYYYDRVTNLPNRDSLILALEKEIKQEIYLGMFFLVNEADLAIGTGNCSVDGVVRKMASNISKSFPNRTYRVGDTKIAIILTGDLFESVAKVQDCLEGVCQNVNDGEFAASIAKSDVGIYRMLYLCENVCRKIKSNTVLVMRAKDELLDEDIDMDQIYQAGVANQKQNSDVFEDIIVESVEIEETQENEKELQEEKLVEPEQEDMSFSFHVPDTEDEN